MLENKKAAWSDHRLNPIKSKSDAKPVSAAVVVFHQSRLSEINNSFFFKW